MKNQVRLLFFALCFLAAIPLLFLSCSGDEPAPDPELVVSTKSLSFSDAGEAKFFHIKSNLAWEVSSSETWLTLSPGTGNAGTVKIDVTATANAVATERTAVITAKVGSRTETISVTQGAASLLTVSDTEFTVPVAGSQISFSVASSGEYTVEIDADWIQEAAGSTTTEPRFEVISNPSLVTREGTIVLKLDDLTQTVTVSQTGNAFTIASNMTGMSSNAMALAAKMKLGWNLGNSLEATSVNGNVYTANETLWGNPKTTKSLIDAVKAAGFNTIRIPCAWSGYIEDQATYKIKDSWLTRVKEVVDYCVANDMYAIINIHWDGGWLENNATPTANLTAIKAKQKALWEQIAVAFRDYDEHLLFAGTNEVHGDGSVATNVPVQESFLKVFIDAVRATGGRNTYRNLLVQTYITNIDYGFQYFTLPSDPTSNRLMVEVHYYDPWDFCGLTEDADWATAKYFWGADFAGNPRTSNWGQEDWVDTEFAKMKTKFIDNNIPVVIGEYGAILRTSLAGTTYTNHVIARNNFLHYVTRKALENGMIPVYWDNGALGNNGSGLFNRTNNTVAYPDAVQAIVSALD